LNPVVVSCGLTEEGPSPKNTGDAEANDCVENGFPSWLTLALKAPIAALDSGYEALLLLMPMSSRPKNQVVNAGAGVNCGPGQPVGVADGAAEGRDDDGDELGADDGADEGAELDGSRDGTGLGT